MLTSVGKDMEKLEPQYIVLCFFSNTLLMGM